MLRVVARSWATTWTFRFGASMPGAARHRHATLAPTLTAYARPPNRVTIAAVAARGAAGRLPIAAAGQAAAQPRA
jgi:hypothetical protein